jgi:hypothetical protein
LKQIGINVTRSEQLCDGGRQVEQQNIVVDLRPDMGLANALFADAEK